MRYNIVELVLIFIVQLNEYISKVYYLIIYTLPNDISSSRLSLTHIANSNILYQPSLLLWNLIFIHNFDQLFKNVSYMMFTL